MQSSFYFNCEILSKSKCNREDLDFFKESLENTESSPEILERIIDDSEINFQGYLSVSLDSVQFENDHFEDIEDLIDYLEEFVPGGCSNDSKIEWIPTFEIHSYVWYKQNGEWNFSKTDNESPEISDEWMDEDRGDHSDYW